MARTEITYQSTEELLQPEEAIALVTVKSVSEEDKEVQREFQKLKEVAESKQATHSGEMRTHHELLIQQANTLLQQKTNLKSRYYFVYPDADITQTVWDNAKDAYLLLENTEGDLLRETPEQTKNRVEKKLTYLYSTLIPTLERIILPTNISSPVLDHLIDYTIDPSCDGQFQLSEDRKTLRFYPKTLALETAVTFPASPPINIPSQRRASAASSFDNSFDHIGSSSASHSPLASDITPSSSVTTEKSSRNPTDRINGAKTIAQINSICHTLTDDDTLHDLHAAISFINSIESRQIAASKGSATEKSVPSAVIKHVVPRLIELTPTLDDCIALIKEIEEKKSLLSNSQFKEHILQCVRNAVEAKMLTLQQFVELMSILPPLKPTSGKIHLKDAIKEIAQPALEKLTSSNAEQSPSPPKRSAEDRNSNASSHSAAAPSLSNNSQAHNAAEPNSPNEVVPVATVTPPSLHPIPDCAPPQTTLFAQSPASARGYHGPLKASSQQALARLRTNPQPPPLSDRCGWTPPKKNTSSIAQSNNTNQNEALMVQSDNAQKNKTLIKQLKLDKLEFWHQQVSFWGGKKFILNGETLTVPHRVHAMMEYAHNADNLTKSPEDFKQGLDNIRRAAKHSNTTCFGAFFLRSRATEKLYDAQTNIENVDVELFSPPKNTH